MLRKILLNTFGRPLTIQPSSELKKRVPKFFEDQFVCKEVGLHIHKKDVTPKFGNWRYFFL
jgi:hypothetical protein